MELFGTQNYREMNSDLDSSSLAKDEAEQSEIQITPHREAASNSRFSNYLLGDNQ